ncbi:hypothetical protein DC522_19310 [Microvirga sp. KLBC 81]|uniref:hypothetical protein n=1 Tax=Microvirga sp. KLBC 81 TaxID=1862707 RepID=UPI000D51EE3B|nr:hypothetical protein [Microvirga sp. KLBC 81]PVE22789.1 hypothetical protein DC522_19310 [Microvirga sp. KLBC 81]
MTESTSTGTVDNKPVELPVKEGIIGPSVIDILSSMAKPRSNGVPRNEVTGQFEQSASGVCR